MRISLGRGASGAQPTNPGPRRPGRGTPRPPVPREPPPAPWAVFHGRTRLPRDPAPVPSQAQTLARPPPHFPREPQAPAVRCLAVSLFAVRCSLFAVRFAPPYTLSSTLLPSYASGMIFRAWSRRNAATDTSESNDSARRAILSHSSTVTLRTIRLS